MMMRTHQKPAPTRYEALLLVVEAYGSQESTGDALGVTQSTVSRWIKQSKQMPPEYVLQAESDTGVPRHYLRPDIYPRNMPPAPRWLGVDQDAGPLVFPSRETRKGNRDSILHLTRSATR